MKGHKLNNLDIQYVEMFAASLVSAGVNSQPRSLCRILGHDTVISNVILFLTWPTPVFFKAKM